MESTSPETTESLVELPPELGTAADSLMKALKAESGIPQAFSDFCARAYIKPEWAGAASEFLVQLFDDREDQLAEMTRIPDLIIELASGHLTLTCMVAYRWAAHSDIARLSKLADALIATQSKINAPEVTHIMLALVTSLAISRYPRAEQMYTVAEAHSGEEHQESLAEAKLWLAAGRLVRGCSTETRELWDHRLRRKRSTWSWDQPNECAALAELAEHLNPDQEGAELFQAIVPAAWWNLAIKRVTERMEQPKKSDIPLPAEPLPPPTWSEVTSLPNSEELSPNIIIWNGWPFLAGWIVGIIVLSLMIWLGPYDLIKSSRLIKTTPSPPPLQSLITNPAQEARADSPEDAWRKEMAAKTAVEFADLKPLFDQIHRDTWTQSESLLNGASPALPKSDPRYLKLLIWLHLDPPNDEEIRARLPAFLADIQANSDTLDLWQRLSYEGSPMRAAIQVAAQRQFHEFKDSWTPTQEYHLQRLGWPQ